MKTKNIILAAVLFMVEVGSLLGQSDRLVETASGEAGNGILSATNNEDTVRVDSINLTNSLWFKGPNNGSRSYIVVNGDMYVQRWRDASQNYGQYLGTDHQFYHDRNSNPSNSVIEFFRRGWNGTSYDITPNGAKMGGIWFTRATGVGTQVRHWMEFNATITDNSNGEGYFSWDIADGDASKNGELLRLTNATSAPSPYRFNRMGAGIFGTGTETIVMSGYDVNGYFLNNPLIFSFNSTAAAAGINLTTNGSGAGSAFIANKMGIFPLSTEEIGSYQFGYNGAPIGGLYGQVVNFSGDVNLQIRTGTNPASDVAMEFAADETVSLPGYASGAKDDTPTKALGLNSSNEMVTYTVASAGSDGNGIFQDVTEDTIRAAGFHVSLPSWSRLTIGDGAANQQTLYGSWSKGLTFKLENDQETPFYHLGLRDSTGTDAIFRNYIDPRYEEFSWTGPDYFYQRTIDVSNGSGTERTTGRITGSSLFITHEFDVQNRIFTYGGEITNNNYFTSKLDAGTGNWSIGTTGNDVGNAFTYKYLNVEGTSTSGDRISLYNGSYTLPNAIPSTTLNDTTIMAWIGDGSNSSPTFIDKSLLGIGGENGGNGIFTGENNAATVAVDTINVAKEVVINATTDNGALKVDALFEARDTINLTGNSSRILGQTQMQIEANNGGSSIGRILLSGNTAVPLQIRDIDPNDAGIFSGAAFSFDSQSNFTAAPGTGFLFSVPGANMDIDADTVKLVDLPNQPWVRSNTYVLTSDQNGHLERSIKGLYSDTTLSVTNGNILSFGTIFADHETTTIESIVNTSASTDNTLLLGTATTAMLGHKIVVTNSDTDTDPASDDYDTALSAISPISLNGTTVSGYMMARGETVTLTIANVGGSPAFVISSSSIRSGNIHTITAAAPTLQLERGIVLQFNAATQGLTTNTLGTSDLEHGDELQIVIVGANGGNDSTLDLDFGNIVWDNLTGDATETFNQARHSFTATWDDVNELLILNGN